jgi:WD40 repeat protein
MPGEKEQVGDPTWSPDGKQILFSSITQTARGWKIEGRILDVTCGKVSKIPEGEDQRPEGWSPDGRYIVALGWSDHVMKILDLKTNRWKVVFTGDANFPTVLTR